MNGLNKVMLIGNLGADPELRYTTSGQPVMSLRVAVTESYLNRQNERQERTEWCSVVVWGKRGEALNKILTKGRQIYVEGRLQTRSWEDKQGQIRYQTEVNATELILLGQRDRPRAESREPEQESDDGGWVASGEEPPF